MDEPATKVNLPAKGMSTKGRRKVTTILVHGSTATEVEADESQVVVIKSIFFPLSFQYSF